MSGRPLHLPEHPRDWNPDREHTAVRSDRDHAPAGKSIRISAPGASGGNRMKYLKGLSIDGRATDKTYLPESIIRTGGDVAFSLSAKPDEAGAQPNPTPHLRSVVAVLRSPSTCRTPIIAIAPGATRTVNLDVQRMIDGASGYAINGTSTDVGITAAPVSGQFASDGSAAPAVAISVAPSVPPDYYLVYLTTTVGVRAQDDPLSLWALRIRRATANRRIRPSRFRSASASPASRRRREANR